MSEEPANDPVFERFLRLGEQAQETKELVERGKELEARHRAGYERVPVTPGELDAWQDEQVWPD